MTNPIPTRITDPIWDFWLKIEEIIPGVRLGGVYANKRGYHNTRRSNRRFWPGDYSIRLAADLRGPSDKAAAIDLTMSTAEMIKRTSYLYRSTTTAGDNRLRALREFIGTRDGNRVYCRIAGSSAGLGSGRGTNDWSRDSSHLWHIHLSILREFVNDTGAIASILSVLRGEPDSTNSTNSAQAPVGNPILELTSPLTSGSRVRQLQTTLNLELGADHEIAVDGWYGENTQAAVERFQRQQDLTVDGIYGPNTAAKLQEVLEEDMPLTRDDVRKIWRTDNIVAKPEGYEDSSNDFWAPGNILRSAQFYAHQGYDEIREVKAQQEALLASVAGGDIMAAVRAELERAAEREQQQRQAELAEVTIQLSQAADERAALLELVGKVESGEVAADEVVRIIGEKLTAVSQT